MKKMICFWAVAVLFCLSACTASVKTLPLETASAIVETTVTQSESAVSVFTTVYREVYTDTSHPNSNISIAYPVLAVEDMQKINTDILNYVTSFAETYYGQTYTDLQLTLEYEIKRYDSKYFSIAFTGTGNVRTAAYPTNLFQTRTYDLNSKQIVTLSDFCAMDNDFSKNLYTSAQNSMSSEVWSVFQVDYPNADVLLLALQSCDTDTTACQSYITPQTVGVSIPIRHVGGDHVEVEIAL